MTITAAGKSRWANIITAIVLVLSTLQGVLSQPPFTLNGILTGSITFAVLLFTYIKQILSPDVNQDKAHWVTALLGLGALLTGSLDYFSILPISDIWGERIKLIITAIVAVINVLSKTFFASFQQKQTMNFLKTK